MGTDDDKRLLRRIAARALCRNELDGLDELDRITNSIERSVRRPHFANSLAATILGLVFFLWTAAWIATEWSGTDTGVLPALISATLFAFAAAPLIYWRSCQYGFGRITKPIAAHYAGASKRSIDNLDRLFAYLQAEDKVRAYYERADGTRRYIDRRYFFGRLRGLLLSEHADVRSIALPPSGFWFSRPIKIDCEPDFVLKAMRARPRSDPRSTKFDYRAMLLAVLEHPTIRAFDLNKPHGATRMMKVIRDICEPSLDHDNDIRVPENSELREFANAVIAAVEKNRSAKLERAA
jgi:hypothetical protein